MPFAVDSSEVNQSCGEREVKKNDVNDRNQLLQQIRGGICLKKIERNEKNIDKINESKGNPLASALSEALQNRFRVNQCADDSSDESEDKNCDETFANEWTD